MRKSFCGLRLKGAGQTAGGDTAAWLAIKRALSQGCRFRSLPGPCETAVPSVSLAVEFGGGIFRPGCRFCAVYSASRMCVCLCVSTHACACVHVSGYMCVYGGHKLT